MTGLDQYHGVFFHGTREETQASRHTLDELAAWSQPDAEGFSDVEEVGPLEVLAELASWPRGREVAIAVMNEHSLAGWQTGSCVAGAV